jgi:CHAT domain-containing protein
LAQWNFLLETAALGSFLPTGGDLAAEERFFEQVGEWLWKPLDIESSVPKVLLLVEGPLTNLPWHAIRVDGEPIARRHQLLHAPSLRHYLHAQRPKSRSDRSAMFVGSRHDLPAVTRELESIRQSLGADTPIFDPCRRDDWPIDGKYRSWHFSGHARLNEQNPFYSALQLEDGPLFAADFRLRRADVDIVTLAACETGTQLETPGEESTGLVRSLLEMGARSVVAAQWPVADGPTALWMGLFYNSLNDDMKPIEAARKASLSVRETFPSAYHWAAFSVYGAGI